MSLSWKPVRRGDIYCSPACGADCKYSDFLKAKEEAKKLCKTLSNGFKSDVWENMGWHRRARKGAIVVGLPMYPDDTYDATHQSPGNVWVRAKTPKKALAALLVEYKLMAKEQNKKLSDVQAAVGKIKDKK